MQRYAYSSRFVNWNNQGTSDNHAGYRKESQDEQDEFWVIPSVFEEEILQGRDVFKGCLVLNTVGWLKKTSDNRFKWKKVNLGRFYVLVGVEPEISE